MLNKELRREKLYDLTIKKSGCLNHPTSRLKEELKEDIKAVLEFFDFIDACLDSPPEPVTE
jgi:hypothetical protein